MGHLDFAWRQSKPHTATPLGLPLVLLLVLLAHLLVAWLAGGLLSDWSFQSPREQLVSARLIMPAPAPPPPAARPRPATKPPADVVAAAPSPTTLSQPSAVLSPPTPSMTGAELGPLEKAEGLRLSRPADLMPSQGAIPLQAYWGRYDQGGQLLGEGDRL